MISTPVAESQESLASEVSPYENSREHLWHHLYRLDQLLRAHTLRWRHTLGEDKPETLWGMIHVSEAEIERYLTTPFTPPHTLPRSLAQQLEPLWRAAEAQNHQIAARQQATPSTTDLRLPRLERLFHLSPLERDILLIALLPELDGRYRRLYAYLADDASRRRPTVELVLQVLQPLCPDPAPIRAALAPRGPLFHNRLLEFDHPEFPLLTRGLGLDDRITAYLLEDDRPDHRLSVLERSAEELADAHALYCSPEQVERLEVLANWWQEQRQHSTWGAALWLHGARGSGRLGAAHALCHALEEPLLVLDAERGARNPTTWPSLVALAYREATLSGTTLYWHGMETLLKPDRKALLQTLSDHAERHPGVTFFASLRPWLPTGRFRQRPFLRFHFPPPSLAERQGLWLELLPDAAAFASPAPDLQALTAHLANSFQLTGGQMADALALAPAIAWSRTPEDPRLTTEDLLEACRRQSSDRLENFAHRVTPRTDLTFQDLVLPPANRQQLDELRTRIRYRNQVLGEMGFHRRLSLGKGLVALFTGSSGTGKTLASELLAREQGVDLYKVDLSNVVSKYVGETEKNLGSIFSQAENANAILFFDEADALFGKRGEVKDARDRWANLEVNYLLQRVEEYSGVVILTSNLRQNIDEAFLRRIQVIVEFPFPDAESRLPIWQNVFPPDLERPGDDDLRALAEQFRISGGEIKNIVLDAAYRALADARDGRVVVALEHLVEATAREYQKAGRPVTRGEFGERFHALLEVRK